MDLGFVCRRANIFFQIVSPSPGTFIIALHYKGREKAILEMDLKIDDLVRVSPYSSHPLPPGYRV
jgi:Ras GTPase-activating-like protein IQGAP2/3